MEWEGREESANVEDRRGQGPGGVAIGGIGTVVIIILGMLFGFDPRQLLQLMQQGPPAAQQGGPPVGDKGPEGQAPRPVDPAEDRQVAFTKVIFHDTETVWEQQFQKLGRQYQKPVLVLYTGRVDSACGQAESAVGPFYCAGDSRVYIDLSFYQDLEQKLNSPGEFARAYVIAHEVGHHVQQLLGYGQRQRGPRPGGGRGEPQNQLSVRMELQADFFAGVWAHYAQEKFKFLETGDIEAALHAAFEIGDDRLQKQATGHVVPDSFTHGTSKQRMHWFKEGFDKGDINEARTLFDLPDSEL
jgi:predicted metalloprotease